MCLRDIPFSRWINPQYPLVQSVKNPVDPFASAMQSLHLISNRGCTAYTLPRVPHLRIYRLTKTHLGIWSGAIKIPSKISQYKGSIYYNTDYRALSYYSDLTLSQELQPMAAQLSKKAALPLAKILATASCRSSKTGPRVATTKVKIPVPSLSTKVHIQAHSHFCEKGVFFKCEARIPVRNQDRGVIFQAYVRKILQKGKTFACVLFMWLCRGIWPKSDAIKNLNLNLYLYLPVILDTESISMFELLCIHIFET